MELEDETFGFPSAEDPNDFIPQEVEDNFENDSNASQNALVENFENMQVEDSTRKPK